MIDAEKIIIYGTGDLSEQLFHYIQVDNRYEIVAFTVEKDYIKKEDFYGIPIVDFDTIEKLFSPTEVKILVCIGYNKMNSTRKRIFDQIKEKGFHVASYIHPNAEVLTDHLGEGNIVLENAHLGIRSSIGDGNLIYNNVIICHDVRVGNFNYISPSSVLLGFSKVMNCCFIGGNATIRDKTSVASYSLVGACAYVSKNTSEAQVVLPGRSVVMDEKSSFDFSI